MKTQLSDSLEAVKVYVDEILMWEKQWVDRWLLAALQGVRASGIKQKETKMEISCGVSSISHSEANPTICTGKWKYSWGHNLPT